MPISQTRMLALINAAADLDQALDKIMSSVRTARTAIAAASDHDRPRVLSEQMSALIHVTTNKFDLLIRPQLTLQTLRSEAEHFSRNRQRNDRARQRQAESRTTTTSKSYQDHLTPAPQYPYFDIGQIDPIVHARQTSAAEINEYAQRQSEAIECGLCTAPLDSDMCFKYKDLTQCPHWNMGRKKVFLDTGLS